VRFGRAKQNWISEICPAFRIILPTLKADHGGAGVNIGRSESYSPRRITGGVMGNHRASIGAEQEGLGPPNALRLPVTRLGSGHPQQTHR
jgi:hypothetical protein